MKTLGAFFKWMKLCDESWPLIKDRPPLGALGLATVAVHISPDYISIPINAFRLNVPLIIGPPSPFPIRLVLRNWLSHSIKSRQNARARPY